MGKRLNNLIQVLGMLVAAYAIYTELQKPPEERTWHGNVIDFVPYDFRVPTLDRIMSRLWNPDDPRIIMPTVFGVGWTVNFAAVYHQIQQRRAEAA